MIFYPLSFSAISPGDSFRISGKFVRILKLQSFRKPLVKILRFKLARF